MNIQEPFKLKSDVRAQVCQILTRRVQDAVEGAQTRDALLAEWDDQLEGRNMPFGRLRWRNSCELTGTLTREAHLELLSLLTQAQRKDPKWQVEAVDPRDDDFARAQEQWLNAKTAAYHLNEHLYNLAFNALRDPVAILYVGWKQSVRSRHEVMYKSKDEGGRETKGRGKREEGTDAASDSSLLVSAEERDLDVAYEEVEVVREEVVSEGCDFRVPDLADFYVYPPNAQSIERAIGVGERMLLTEDELLDGIEAYGYDAEQVAALLRCGPTHVMSGEGDFRARRDAYEGLDGGSVEFGDGYYECFLWFSRLPRLRDASGEFTLSEAHAQQDMLCMLCPAHGIVFRLDYSPYAERPYIPFSILPKPGRFLGVGVCQLLEQLQEEETATIRYTIDGLNMEMAPVLLAPAEWITKFGRWSIYPGAILPQDMQGELKPLQWAQNSAAGLELTAQIRAWAQGVVAAKGYGQLDAKQRKNGEMQNVLTATDAKFDLFLSNFQLGMVELARRIVALEMAHIGEQGQSYRSGGVVQTISTQQLQGEYIYLPTATSTTSSPELRLRLDQAKQQAQGSFFAALTKLPPQFGPLLWHSTREILLDLGVRRPEEWIGPEPSGGSEQSAVGSGENPYSPQPIQHSPLPVGQSPLPVGQSPPAASLIPAILQALQTGIPPQLLQQLLVGSINRANAPIESAQGAQGE